MRFLIVLIILIFSSTAFADPINRAEINKSLKNIKSVSLEHQGIAGVWFSAKDADTLLQLVSSKLPQAIDTIDSQSKQINALKDAVISYKDSKSTYKELAEVNLKMFNIAIEHIPDLNPPKPTWYESAKATYIYGVVTGIGVILVSAWVLDKTL